jgi:hypothetical protein
MTTTTPNPNPPAGEELTALEFSRLSETERGKKALRIIDAAAADRAALTAQCQRDYQLAADWKARAAELEVELGVLATRCETAFRERAEAERKAATHLHNAGIYLSDRKAAESECAALSAEAERLRTPTVRVCEELTHWERQVICGAPSLATLGNAGTKALAEAGHAIASEDRLAAAHALLRRVLAKDPLARRDIRTFLTAQPAAPCDTCEDAGLKMCPCTEGDNGRGWQCRLERGHDGVCRFYDQPAALVRTEAEQRVLDACAKARLHNEEGEPVICVRSWNLVADLELARRSSP